MIISPIIIEAGLAILLVLTGLLYFCRLEHGIISVISVHMYFPGLNKQG